MIRFFVLRFVLPLLLFFLIRALLKSIFSNSQVSRTPQPSSQEAPPFRAGGDLKKDPVCGTFVSADTALTRNVKGDTLYFCSSVCRDKYQA